MLPFTEIAEHILIVDLVPVQWCSRALLSMATVALTRIVTHVHQRQRVIRFTVCVDLIQYATTVARELLRLLRQLHQLVAVSMVLHRVELIRTAELVLHRVTTQRHAQAIMVAAIVAHIPTATRAREAVAPPVLAFSGALLAVSIHVIIRVRSTY